MTRKFTDTPAKREAVPCLVGIMGPSGGGKTFSALRIATGMQKVTGGEIFVIDTEHRRALHYADRFKFRHIDFRAPFSPDDYREAIEHAVSQGGSILVVDSMSHEHDGPGGVLEWHDREMGGNQKKSMIAWAKPKAARRKLLTTILHLGVSAVFTFRAKEKIKPKTGGEPDQLGWMPIAGEEFLYEMTLNCLLPPNAGGRPDWNPEGMGSKMMVKLPAQFAKMRERTGPLDESVGERLAAWAAGDSGKLPGGGGDKSGGGSAPAEDDTGGGAPSAPTHSEDAGEETADGAPTCRECGESKELAAGLCVDCALAQGNQGELL